MNPQFKRLERTVYDIAVDNGQKFLFLSDVHFDAMKCDRALLRRHLKQAMTDNAIVLVFGDWFDLMQGKWDPRGSYSDLRPEYKVHTYLDNVVDDSALFLADYPCVKFISRGNHETNVEKRMHTSPLDRLAALTPHRPMVAGYSGFIRVRINFGGKPKFSSWLHFHHGFGGSAPRSKGVLAVDLDQMQFPDADLIIRGHTHQKWHVPMTVDRITERGRRHQKTTHHLRTGSYKLLGDRFGGWATEKGFNTPRLGGWWAACYKTQTGSVRWDITEAN